MVRQIKSVVVIISALLFASCNFVNINKLNRYDNDNKKHGVWITLYPDTGKLKEIHGFKHGQDHGKCATFYLSGKIEGTGNYRNGKMEGKWKIYNSSGHVISEGKYKHGEIIYSRTTNPSKL